MGFKIFLFYETDKFVKSYIKKTHNHNYTILKKSQQLIFHNGHRHPKEGVKISKNEHWGKQPLKFIAIRTVQFKVHNKAH